MSPRSPLVLLALLALASACDRKVEEPMPEVRPRDPSSVRADLPPQPTAAPKPTWDPRCPRDPETPPNLRRGRLAFTEVGESVTVEIAERDHDRQRGLMYRKSMPEREGMLFKFEEKEDHSFWMHNTCISLDMLFIDEAGVVVGIAESTPTMSDQTFSVGKPSLYVLELNAGFCRARGIKAGHHVKMDGI